MNRSKLWVSVLAAFFVAVLPLDSLADAPPARVTGVSNTYYMCNAQVGTGVCMSSSGDEIVLNASELEALTFYSDVSTATTYTCNVRSGSLGHDDGGSTNAVNVTSLSETQEVLTLSGPFLFVWIHCPENPDNQVTVKVRTVKAK